MTPRVILAVAVAAGVMAGGGSLAALARGADRALARAEARVDGPPKLVGVTVGASLEDARATLERRGVHCVDTSIATIAAKAHAEARAKREARGEAAPEMTAGKILLHAKMLASMPTQARLACEARTGRVLVISDAPAKPVSLVSQQRTYPQTADAAADFGRVVTRLTGAYGAPVETQGEALGHFGLVARTWRVGGVVVRLRATDLGKRGAMVTEELALR